MNPAECQAPEWLLTGDGGWRRWGPENSDASSWRPVWLQQGGGSGEDVSAVSTPSLTDSRPSSGHSHEDGEL